MVLSRILLWILPLALLMASGQRVAAEPGDDGNAMVFGGSLALAAPTGDLEKSVGLGFGGFMHVAKFVAQNFALSGTLGVLYHLEKKDIQLTELPVLGGVNYYFGTTPRVLLFAQVGLVAVRSSTELDVARFTETESKFGSQLGMGVAIGPGIVRVAVMAPSLPDFSDGFHVMGSYELSIVER